MSVHKPQPFWRERRAEAVLNRGPSAYQPNALPLGQTGSRIMDLYLRTYRSMMTWMGDRYVSAVMAIQHGTQAERR